MTKIVFLIPTLMHGGAEKVLVNLVNNLDKAKYDITLFSIFDQGVNKEFLNKDINYQYKFKKVFRGNSQIMKLFSPKFLYKFLVKEDYDLVISFLEGPTARIISGCTNTKTKKIAWIHSDTLNKELAAVGFRNFTEAQKCYEKFDRIVGVSQNVINSFDRILELENQLTVLYNVNETEEKKTKSKDSIECFSEENIPQVYTAGKLTKVKGFDRLIDVHHKLLTKGFPHQVNVLGIGEEQDYLEKKIKELGVRNSFKLLGFHKNPYQFIAKSDLYICASHREGFSTAVTEALILGIPVISTNVSGAEELLGSNNEFGVVTENSTEGIYEGLKMLLSNPEKLAHYKKQAELRGNNFSKEKTMKAVENLFDSLLHE